MSKFLTVLSVCLAFVVGCEGSSSTPLDSSVHADVVNASDAAAVSDAAVDAAEVSCDASLDASVPGC